MSLRSVGRVIVDRFQLSESRPELLVLLVSVALYYTALGSVIIASDLSIPLFSIQRQSTLYFNVLGFDNWLSSSLCASNLPLSRKLLLSKRDRREGAARSCRSELKICPGPCSTNHQFPCLAFLFDSTRRCALFTILLTRQSKLYTVNF